jgi:hypothetical protein
MNVAKTIAVVAQVATAMNVAKIIAVVAQVATVI